MTYEINTDFDQIIINSENLINTNLWVKLVVTHNCSSTYTFDIPVNDTLIELTPTSFSQDDIFSEGPYNFTLTSVLDDGTIITEIMCKYIQPDACAYIDLYKDTTEMSKVLAHQALLTLNECEQCSCSDACLFYSTLTETDCNDCTCGCSKTKVSPCNGSC